MSKAIQTQQKQLITIRDMLYAQEEKFKEALPKWLTPDRFLRVVYSSIVQNPRLADCTRESLLISVMRCASLGLEPILGRAYLIPYNNSKYINGEWQKVLECQFQVGYQGLIDLARRSGTITDVRARVVYENDDFDIQFEKDPPYKHRPWYLVKGQESGEKIGAYAEWVLKDGTRHFEFMPIHEIFKRRDKSQAYQFAEDNKKKGGGKKDSIWHVWEDDMCIKTVIKYSSKMVPASIEFMQAVQTDDASDTGKYSDSPFSLAFDPNVASLPEVTPSSIENDFDTFVQDNDLDKNIVNQMVEIYITTYNSSRGKVIEEIVKGQASFIEAYKTFINKNKPAAPETVADKVRNLRSAGMKQFVKDNDIETFSEEDKAIVLEKYKRVVGVNYYDEPLEDNLIAKEDKTSTPATIIQPRDQFIDEMVEYQRLLGHGLYMKVLNENDWETLDDVLPEEQQRAVQVMKEAWQTSE